MQFPILILSLHDALVLLNSPYQQIQLSAVGEGVAVIVEDCGSHVSPS